MPQARTKVRVRSRDRLRNVQHKGFLKTFKKEQAEKAPKTKHQAAQDRMSTIIMRAVQANYPESAFTRDDVLMLISRMRLGSEESWASYGGLNDTTTGTRYVKICESIKELVSTGNLRALDWLRLCLPSQFKRLSTETPDSVAYIATVRRIVQQFEKGSVIDVITIVENWRSDPQLPDNLKRMAVRGMIPVLKREALLKQGPLGEIIVA
jgi:hypothetical protein